LVARCGCPVSGLDNDPVVGPPGSLRMLTRRISSANIWAASLSRRTLLQIPADGGIGRRDRRVLRI
jgi:hypothetical protein